MESPNILIREGKCLFPLGESSQVCMKSQPYRTTLCMVDLKIFIGPLQNIAHLISYLFILRIFHKFFGTSQMDLPRLSPSFDTVYQIHFSTFILIMFFLSHL